MFTAPFRAVAFASTLLVTALVSAQFTDDFEDGSLTDGPVWSGSSTFEPASGKLHLNAAVAGTSYLQSDFAMASLDNMEWRVQVRQNFAPSANNYGRVYLVSDQADLTGALNGYFLQFGENGSLDAVELFKQTGLTTTSICRGTDGEIAAAFTIGVRVLRDGTGTWSISVDPAGGTSYIQEASGTDASFTTSAHLGVRCTYTVSNISNFYYDDVYAGPTIVDNVPPAIVSVIAISAMQVDVHFSEALDPAFIGNYDIIPFIGVSAQVLDGIDATLVHVTPAIALTNGNTYGLSGSDAQDLAGNVMAAGDVFEFLYAVPEVPQPGDVVINEIMADPTPPLGLPEQEFVELYNTTTNKSFDLAGWTYSDGGSTLTLPSTILPPGGYIIITSTANVPAFTPFGTAIAPSGSISLTNTGDPVTIKDPGGVVIDAVTYSIGWYQDAIKAQGGWTLERIDPTTPCSSANNWRASVAPIGGTPGAQNSVFAILTDVTPPTLAGVQVISSTQVRLVFNEWMNAGSLLAGDYLFDPPLSIDLVEVIDQVTVQLTLAVPLVEGQLYTITLQGMTDCPGNAIATGTSAVLALPQSVSPGDVVINEVLYDPRGTGSDFVELYNRSQKVLSLANWKLANESNGVIGSPLVMTTDARLFMPGEYLLITENKNNTLAEYPQSHPDRFLETDMPSYNNGFGVVVLQDPLGDTLDRFAYSDDLHFALLNGTEGVSLERVSPDRPSSDNTNWHSAAETAGFATPGFENSQFSVTMIASGELTIGRKIFSPDNDGFEDLLTINYRFQQPGFTGTMKVLDIVGREVRTLLDNDLLSTNGAISWDGITDSGDLARMGPYVVYLEAFDLAGNVEKFKETVVLAHKL